MKTKIKHGVIIQFDHNIKFKDGTVTNKFVYCKQGRRHWFRLPYQCGVVRYNIPDWEHKNYEIVGYMNPEIAESRVEQTSMFE